MARNSIAAPRTDGETVSLRFAILALAALCVVVYFNTFFGGFIYDDIPAILQNPRMMHPRLFLLDPPGLTYSLNFLAGKGAPLIFHVTNVALHAAATCAIFFFLKLFFPSRSSLLGAALFAAHPIHAEAVSWITARPFLFMGLFITLTYLLYHWSTVTFRRGGKVNRYLYMSALGLFSYCMARNISFYFLVPVFLSFSDLTFGRWRRSWKLWIPFFAIAALRIFFLRSFISGRVDAVARDAGIASAWQNPLPLFVYSMLEHAGLMLWPQRLTLFHDPRYPAPLFAAAIGAVGVGVCAAVLLRRRAPVVFFALGTFALFLAPTYSPLTLGSLVGERYAYFPSVALSLIAAYYLERLRGAAPALRQAAMLAALFIIAAFGVRTVSRNEDWRDQSRFWRATLIASPLSPWAHNNMGFAYQKEGNLGRALMEYQRAIELKPELLDAHNNLATVLYQVGRVEDAIAVYKRLLTLDPSSVKAYNNLGVIYNQQGDLEKAIEAYRRTIEIDPRYALGYFNLSQMYASSGRRQEALEAYQKAVALEPNLAQHPSALKVGG